MFQFHSASNQNCKRTLLETLYDKPYYQPSPEAFIPPKHLLDASYQRFLPKCLQMDVRESLNSDCSVIFLYQLLSLRRCWAIGNSSFNHRGE
ncbi:hypothetical protein CEXT_183941 [Caerostris extrusa]|uniref:Uncharacterized protein n=1 Tax=Caerostris extrusa TaxID=172846 RepID=A0AAV4XP36_CAEEX|nr:hypothetical protein CEXT_183941 [Caerostris extrusa]